MYRDPTALSPDGYDVRHVDDLASASGEFWASVPALVWGPPPAQTTFRAVWSDLALLARFDAVDAHPWFTITDRDGHLWNEEVVEIFLGPGGSPGRYAEFEVNPANTVCDLLVRAPWPDLDADLGWDCPGVSSRVSPLCDAGGGPCGWSVELTIPWAGLSALGTHAAASAPPRRGDCWRFNVFRIDRPHGPADPERDAVYAAWSVPAGPSFHDTKAFRDLRFR